MRDDYETLEISIAAHRNCVVALNRPEVHNAFNEEMIDELADVLEALRCDETFRSVTIAGNGRSFCAGADLDWMRRTSQYSEDENLRDAERFAQMLNGLHRLACPTIARIHGAVYGGGIGLVACCDIAVASDDSVFSVSEVKLGLIPSVISPYVVQAIGARNSRRYFLTGERFDARTAAQIGLIHEYCPVGSLSKTCEQIATMLLAGGPNAHREAKSVIQSVANRKIDAETISDTSSRIAQIRASDEAQEGMSAFFEKRAPRWHLPEGD